MQRLVDVTPFTPHRTCTGTCVGSEIAFLSKSRSLHIIVYKSTHLYAIICKERDLGERDLELEGFRDRVPSINRDVWFTMQ